MVKDFPLESGTSGPGREPARRAVLTLLSLAAVVALVVSGVVALVRPAAADGLQFSVGVTGPTDPVPTNSTVPFTVSVNCRTEGGCAGASITIPRPRAADGSPLAGTMQVSLASGTNPAITYTLTGAAGDAAVLTFTRFDYQISQVFQVSWQSADPTTIPGTYTTQWRAQFPKVAYDVTDRVSATVTGTPTAGLSKRVNDYGNIYNGALRTFTLTWNRVAHQIGNTGATAVLVDQLPPEYVFKGFTETMAGPDQRFRSLNGSATEMVTEDGSAVYEYDAANHRVLVRITRNVDRHLATRNANIGLVGYTVQVNGGSGDQQLANNTKITNTVTATDVASVDGKPLTVAPSSVTLNYTRNRPGVIGKDRTIGEYSTTTSDNPAAADMVRPWRLRVSNPGDAPADVVATDTTRWDGALTATGDPDYRYVSRVTVDPVVYNDGPQSYGATVIGTSADGSIRTYPLQPNETLDIPVADRILSLEVRVAGLRPMDAMPSSSENGVLGINVTHSVRVTTAQITQPGTTRNSVLLRNTASFKVGGVDRGSAATFYTIYGRLPSIQPGISVQGQNVGTNFNLPRAGTFTSTVNLTADSQSGRAHPEAFLVLPVGFTLGAAPAFRDSGTSNCQVSAADWRFERMADYSGAERWRLTLAGGKILDPDVGQGTNCFLLDITAAQAQAGTYDKTDLTSPAHAIVLSVRELGGSLAHPTMNGSDTYDINSDGDRGGQWRTANLASSVASTSSLGVAKTVTGDLSPTPTYWEYGTNEKVSYARSSADFTVTASTEGTNPVRDLVLYDMLPNARNTGANFKQLVSGVTPDRALTTFSPDLAGAVSAVGHNKAFTVYYTTAADPCRPELSSAGVWPAGCTGFNDRGEWTTDLSSLNPVDVTAVRIAFLEPVFGDFSFRIPMSMPASGLDGKPIDDADVATNRAAVGGRSQDGTSRIPYVGPVYARLSPAGSLGVDKSAEIAGTAVDQGPGSTPPVLRRGDEFIYVVRATADPKGAGLADPVVADALPSGLEFVDSAGSDGTYDAATGQWHPGALTPGQSKYLRMKARVTGAGTISNVAVFQNRQGETPPATPQSCPPVADDATLAPCDSFPIHVDAGSGALSGSVFDDLDWSDTQNSGDGARAGVQVFLKEVLAGGELRRINQAVTGADGTYSFTGLPAATYVVTFGEEQGVRYARPKVGGDPATDSDVTRDLQVGGAHRLATDPMTLAEGQRLTDIDLGVQPLSTISGVAFDDRDGDGVRDPAADGPLSGVRVDLVDAAGAPARVGYPNTMSGGVAPTGSATTTTAADGSYAFAGVRPGQYSVRFTRPDGYAYTTRAGVDGAVTDPGFSDVDPTGARAGSTSQFTAAVGSTPNVDAGFAGLSSIGGLVWTDDDNDGKVSAGESPRPGVTVTLTGDGGFSRTTTTGADGRYEFTDLVPGTYTLTVVRPDGTVYSRQVDGRPDRSEGSDVDAAGRSVGTVPPNAHWTGLDAGLAPLSQISGSIFYDDNGNALWDPAEPLKVRPLTMDLFRAGEITRYKRVTTVDGHYSFADVPPGDYYIRLTNPWAANVSPRTDETDVTVPRNNDFEAGPNKTGFTRDFQVRAGRSYPDVDAGILRQQHVNGLVWDDADGDGIRDAGEGPRAGVTVTLTNDRGQTLTQVTDDQGRYDFANVLIGQATVTVAAPAGTVHSPRTTDAVAGLEGEDRSDVDAAGVVSFPVTGYTDPTDVAEADVTHVDAGLVTPTSVRGTVFADTDRDGARDRAEGGRGDVLVRLHGPDGALVAETRTAPDGSYVFTSVPPGTGYRVEVVAPAGAVFGPRSGGPVTDPGLNDAGADGYTAPFTVTGGTPVTDVDAGLVTTASVSGLAWDDTTGDDGIRAASGEGPLAGIPVELLDDAGRVVASVLTGADGTYAFDAVDPGTYRVRIGRSDAHLPSLRTFDDPQDVDRNNVDRNTLLTAPFSVVAGEVMDHVDVGLVLTPGMAGTVFADLDGDGVRGPGEPGVAGVTVRSSRPASGDSRTVVTDANGNWFIPARGGAEYETAFDLPAGYAYSPSTDPDRPVTEPLYSDVDAGGRVRPITIPVGSERINNVDAGLLLGADISGLAFVDADADGVRDAGETTRAGVPVHLVWHRPDGTTERLRDTVTAADGTYSFANVPEGDYSVLVESGTTSVFSPTTGAALGEPDRNDVDPSGASPTFAVRPGQRVRTVDAGLVDLATVSGRVFGDTDRDGLSTSPADTGRSGVPVTLYREVAGTWQAVASATTAADGGYSFPGLEPGRYQVGVETPTGALPTAQGVGSDRTVDSDVDGSGRTAAFDLRPGQSVQHLDAGYVTDATMTGAVWVDVDGDGVWDADERPYTGLQVFAYLTDGGDDWIARATTDASGRYQFLDVPAGQYSIRFVTPEGYVFSPHTGGADVSVPRLSDVDPVDGRTPLFPLVAGHDRTDIDAGIVPTSSLSGRAFSDANRDGAEVGEQPRAGVTVVLRDAGGVEVARTTTAADGSYSFAGLRPGRYTVEFARAEGEVFSPLGADSTVDAAGRTTVTVVSERPTVGVDAGYVSTARISGFAFLDYNGDGDYGDPSHPVRDPAAGVTVRVVDADGRPIDGDLGRPRTVGADGNYSIDVPPGTYRLQFLDTVGLEVTTYPTRVGPITDAWLNDIDAQGLTPPITVRTGEEIPNIDGGFKALGVISGTVFDDTDGDQLKTLEPGVGGVTVRLLDRYGNPVRGADGQPVVTQTDAFGRYAFTNVSSGTYAVQFVAPGGRAFFSGGDSPLDGENRRVAVLTITPQLAELSGIDGGLDQVVPPTETTTTSNTSDTSETSDTSAASSSVTSSVTGSTSATSSTTATTSGTTVTSSATTTTTTSTVPTTTSSSPTSSTPTTTASTTSSTTASSTASTTASSTATSSTGGSTVVTTSEEPTTTTGSATTTASTTATTSSPATSATTSTTVSSGESPTSTATTASTTTSPGASTATTPSSSTSSSTAAPTGGSTTASPTPPPTTTVRGALPGLLLPLALGAGSVGSSGSAGGPGGGDGPPSGPGAGTRPAGPGTAPQGAPQRAPQHLPAASRPGTGPAAAGSAPTSPGSTSRGPLAQTGADVVALIGLSGALIALGVLLIRLRRKDGGD